MYVALVVVAAVLVVAVAVMGLVYLVAPVASARGFGLPAWPDGPLAAWLNIKGVRDVAVGAGGLVMLAAGGPRVMAWFLLVGALIPIGDAVIVLRYRGSRLLALAMHGATAAVVVALAVALLLAG
jgi:hypothetical protein